MLVVRGNPAQEINDLWNVETCSSQARNWNAAPMIPGPSSDKFRRNLDSLVFQHLWIEGLPTLTPVS